MKTMLRAAAVLSFGLCFSGGFLMFLLVVSNLGDAREGAPVLALGLVLMGMAVFAGAMIWWAAERLCSWRDGKAERNLIPPI